MISSLFVVAATSLLATVSARPLAREAGCTPSFNGLPVAVTSSDSDGLLNVDGVSTFLVQQDGQYPASFVVRNSNDPNQAVTAVGTDLELQTASNSGDHWNQLFNVVCNDCSNNNGGRCAIQSVGTGLCLDAASGNLGTCDQFNAAQAFDLVTAPQKREAETCTPVTDGEQISILSRATDAELIVEGTKHFLFQQDGKEPAKFVIKDAHNVNQAITLVNDELALRPVTDAGNDVDQTFTLVCSACAPVDHLRKVVADVCYFATADKSKCLDADSNSLQACQSKDSQLFTLALSH
ncbi:hypothetical protein V5O48_010787 [Marasmius crinis-equi]|uniref:Uncharacterized protein n=1 Tax=Marasmius crinis-equi TaxID=585013 RepID=A0ABR3F7Y6_9AGAR